MLKGKDIIIVGQQPWDTEIGSNCKDIALELSKANRVLYVNSALDRATKYRSAKDPRIIRRLNVISGKENGLVQIKENLYNLYPNVLVESINWINSTSLFQRINKYNNKKFAKSILKAVNELGLKNYLLLNDNEMFKAFFLKDFLKPVLSAYYSRDNMIGVDYWKKHGETLEPAIISKSDLCVANSVYLANYCRQYNPDSFYVGQGCDFTQFSNENLQIPQDMQNITKPVIGYVGALSTSRLDLTLLENIVSKQSAWSFVFVGPEDEGFKSSKLHQLPNAHFLGAKSPQSLASYINSFDVCMNPQYVNPITIGNYPRKIDEYLALGKPTIATKTESMLDFEKYVLLANDEESYINGIRHLLETDNDGLQKSRRAFALSHTWERSVELILQAFTNVAAEKRIVI